MNSVSTNGGQNPFVLILRVEKLLRKLRKKKKINLQRNLMCLCWQHFYFRSIFVSFYTCIPGVVLQVYRSWSKTTKSEIILFSLLYNHMIFLTLLRAHTCLHYSSQSFTGNFEGWVIFTYWHSSFQSDDKKKSVRGILFICCDQVLAASMHLIMQSLTSFKRSYSWNPSDKK